MDREDGRRYCIECESEVHVRADNSHVVMTWYDDEYFCYGPFTYSTPPAYPENWHEIVQEPDDEELALMNEEAELLLADLQAV